MADKAIQLKDASDNNLFPITNYNNSVNMPSINGVPLIGNKTLDELGMIGVGKKLLWQNPSPSAAFNGQTVTLSEDPENYDALLFVSLYQGIYHTDFVMIGSSTFTIVSYKDSTTSSSSDTTLAWRNVTISGRAVTINNAMYNSASAGGYNRNDLCIPIYIYGVKFSGTDIGSGHGVSNKELLWSNSNPTNNFAAQTITVSKNTGDYDALLVVAKYSTTDNYYDTSLIIPNNIPYPVRVSSVNYNYNRLRWFTANDSSITISIAEQLTVGGSVSETNNHCIPVSIYGICFGSKTVNQFNYSLPNVNNSNLADLIYPVGSIYASTSSANPSTIFGGTWEQLSRNNYNTKQWPTTTTTIASGGNNSTTLTITTNGGPVYLAFSGDINPSAAAATWGKASIRRGSTILSQHIFQSIATASYNETFSVQCIDAVEAGTHTYTFYIQSGNAAFALNEDGSNPCTCSAFELGADPSLYKWRRTA